MVRFFPVYNFANPRKTLAYVLAFAWVAGLVTGSIVALNADRSFYSLMRMMPMHPVSIVGLLLSLCLPLLFTVVAVYISYQWILLIIAFLKALFLAMLFAGVWISYGIGGWVVAGLLLLPDFIAAIVLIWLWFYAIMERRAIHTLCICSLLVFFLIGFLDYSYISPFLENILS